MTRRKTTARVDAVEQPKLGRSALADLERKQQGMLNRELKRDRQRAAALGSGALEGGVGRQVASLSALAVANAVDEHGPEILTTKAGMDELLEQARFAGVAAGGGRVIPGRRNRFGCVTAHRRADGVWVRRGSA
jgi:hypothetical protein